MTIAKAKKNPPAAGFASNHAAYLAGDFLTGFLLFFGFVVAFVMIVFPSLKVAIAGEEINPGLRLTAI